MNKRQKEMLQRSLDNEEAVIRELKKVYKQAQRDIELKIMILQKRTVDIEAELGTVQDAARKEILESMWQSKIYQTNYQEALKMQIDAILESLQVGEYTTITEYLHTCYEEGFLGALFDLQGQGIPLIYPMNQDSVVKAVLTDSKISGSLYSRLGEDVQELKKSISAELARGISTGATYKDIAQQIAFRMTGTYDTEGGALAKAMRIARTEGHRIQVQASMDACRKARDLGADVAKQWNSILDHKTRKGHSKVDGEIRELDEPFSNGLMQPGDPEGKASEVVNCRCGLNQRARWALDREETKMLGDVSKMKDEQKKAIAEKLKIPVSELAQYSNQIIPIKAKDYEDFKRQYNQIWRYEGSDLQKQAEAAIAKRRKG